MIKLFQEQDTNFSTNGDLIVKPTRAVVHKEDNGSFYLDLETNFNVEKKNVEAEAGSTIEGSIIQFNADTTKEDSYVLKGNTTQNGTPTPSTPIPINVATGLQDVNVCGNNLANIEDIVIGKSWNNANNGVRATILYIPVERNQTYSISSSYTNTHITQIRWVFNDGASLNAVPPSPYNNTSYDYVSIEVIADTTFTSDMLDGVKIMFNKGNTALPYEPYIGKDYEIDLPVENYVNNTTGTITNNDITYTQNENGSITANGTSSGVSYYNITKPTLQAGTYTLSGCPSGGSVNSSYKLVMEYNGTSAVDIGNGATFTINSETTATQFYIEVRSGKTLDNLLFNIQIEKGTKANHYTPYGTTPIELCKIGNYQDRIFKSSGKNLFDRDNATTQVGYFDTTGNINNGGASTLTTSYTSIEPNTNITISGINLERICIYDSNKNFIERLDGNGTTINTINVNAYYIRLQSATSGFNLNTIMINEGSTALPYEPYGSGKWYLYKEIGEVVLDGSETGWSANTSGANKIFYRQVTGKSGNNIISCSNYFKYNSANNWQYINNNEFTMQLNSEYIFIRYDEAGTLTNFKTWLSTHPTSVYYALATPTCTEITDIILINQLESIELLNGLNNLSITSANLPMIMNLHYNYVTGGEITTSYVDLLTPNKILVANTPQGEQAFRISNVEKTRTKLKIKANHLFYDSKNYVIKDSYVVEKTCNQALDHLNDAVDTPSPFTMTSDITALHSYRCIRSSLYEAIQVVLERWGGHLVRDDFDIKVMNSIGTDNGVTIRYGKNLKDIDAQYNWENVVTKLMPVGADGLLLTEEYLYSSTTYDIPYTKVVSFDQSNIEKDNYETDDAYNQALMDDLRAKGQAYLETNCIPMVNYTLNANLEKISDVGDTIQVIDERLGVELMTNLIAFDFDCIMERYTQVQFGNFKPTLNNLMTTIAETTTEQININNEALKVTLGQELEDATDKIWSTLGNSYVIYDGDKILVLDALPKESATNVIMISNGGIGFSNTGINGTFSSAWTIDNTLNMENINVINLTADLIRGGVLKLGSNLNQYGQIEIYNETNTLIAEMNKNGLKMYGIDGSYVLLNNQVGLAGYDRNDTKIYWADGNAFHMKKSEVEEEITLCGKMRYIPIQIRSGNTITNDGIGLVSVLGGGN